MERLPYLKLALVTFVIGTVISLVMVQINWFGDSGSTAAGPIDHLLNIMIVLSAYIFSVVCVALGYALIKWRVKPGDESDGLPIHGNTRLEIVWTLIPTVIVLFAGGYSWHVLNEIEKVGPDAMTINVYSQQYAWTFGYPESGNKWSEGELHVPVDQQIEFELHAQDVLHSFWVPEWRIKEDNVPGITTKAVVTPDKIGTYQLVCTELCGYGHTTMRAKVVVQSRPAYNKWVAALPDKVPTDLLLTADQANALEKQLQVKSGGIEGTGVIQTGNEEGDSQ